MVRSFVLRKREKQFHAQQLEKWSEPKLRELLKKLTDAKPEKLQHSIGTISTLRGTYRRWCCMDISHDKDVDYAPLTQDYIKWLRDLLQWGEEILRDSNKSPLTIPHTFLVLRNVMSRPRGSNSN
ncbi:hypothetical protein BU26DRAFT_559009 [Trematosphaeria pertusa]|uniref:Uncharacterized protein n=1 Tax=Trematosphaeria pertusa TaxID=390896 RepID=A0A6A6IYQ0_9PLEO|nr:uncharacterized protein BU26DRAFT_559009 [Trematosphaeria pertusa]KAF2254313.1 hypothetical protein BU26DRAFT_559009 [Trematosphaeria pertusa]